MSKTRVESLPGECLSCIMSYTSPLDACRSSLVSSFFRKAADSDQAWEKFLPSDYREIVSKSVDALEEFSALKDLFHKLSSSPLLIDGGRKSFSIDKRTNKKCYMVSARELSITWAAHSLYWSWKPLSRSRFAEAAELIMVCWLEIKCKISSQILSPNTTYGAYLVIQLADRAFGLGVLPSEVCVEVGECYKTQGTVCLKKEAEAEAEEEYKLMRRTLLRRRSVCCVVREDGWMEVELGEFYNDESEKEVKMMFREIKGEHLKGGLIVEGIEIRPKF